MSSIKLLFLLSLLLAVFLHTIKAQDDFFEEEEEEEEDEECPEYFEDKIVKGHLLTFYPCCLRAGTECGPTSGVSVCGEANTCQSGDCLMSFGSMCEACTTPGVYQYAEKPCPTKRKCPPDTYPDYQEQDFS